MRYGAAQRSAARRGAARCCWIFASEDLCVEKLTVNFQNYDIKPEKRAQTVVTTTSKSWGLAAASTSAALREGARAPENMVPEMYSNV